jgi:acyl-coenzyme A thioesterase PaaI-like protein
MGFIFYRDGDRLVGEGTLRRPQQGPPGHAHGGSLASILDEAMGFRLWTDDHKVVAAHLEFDYRHPTPLDVPLRVEAVLDRAGSRSYHTSARITLPDGTVTVEGKGVFVELGDEFMNRFGDFWGKPTAG